MHHSRRGTAAPQTLAVALFLASLALTALWPGPAQAGISMERIAEYRSGAAFDTGGVAGVAYHAAGARLDAYVVNDSTKAIDIIRLDDPRAPSFILSIDVSTVMGTVLVAIANTQEVDVLLAVKSGSICDAGAGVIRNRLVVVTDLVLLWPANVWVEGRR